MVTPEKPKGEEGKNFTEKWWKKWLELFQSFVGVKELEKVVADLAGEEQGEVIKEALNSLSSEDKLQKKESFVRKLSDLLSSPDEPEARNEINKLLNETLETNVDVDAKKVVARFAKVIEDPAEDEKAFTESTTTISERKQVALETESKQLKKAGFDDDELKRVRDEIDVNITEEKPLTNEESETKLDTFWRQEESRLVADEVTNKIKKPTYSTAFDRRELFEAQRIYEKTKNASTDLTDKEKSFLENFLVKQMDRNPEIFEILLNQLAGRLGQDATISLMTAVSEQRNAVEAVSLQSSENVFANHPLNKFVEAIYGRQNRDGTKNYAQFNENDWEQMRVSGLLNIDKLRYEDLTTEAQNALKLKVRPIIVDEKKKIATLNKALTEEEVKKVNAFFRKKLISEVRMLVDESVRIDVNTADLRATEYVTIMSIMGLSTSMKSDVMNSARRMTFSFIVFNTPQTEDGYRQIKEFAAQIGPEYSIFNNVMKMREAISIKNKEGKEVLVTDLSQIDFVNAASQAILNQEDRDYYGLKGTPQEVGRLYSDMMMASNRDDVRKEDWIPVTRMTLQERLGPEGYIDKLKELGVINPETGVRDANLERQYLREIGKKYWDYYNGIYIYYLMTRASGEFVGNAHPDNSRMETPAGLNENFNYKMDPSAWMTFLDTYDIQNFPEMAQTFRFNGNSSLASKEGGEVLSYLVETQMSPVKKIPSLAEAFYRSGEAPKKLDKDGKIELDKENKPKVDTARLAKLRHVFVDSIFLKDQYHIHGDSKHLAEKTTLYEALPQKYETVEIDGKPVKLLKLDATAQRRDFATARTEMEKGLRALHSEDPSLFDTMDFEFLKREFAHDNILKDVLDSNVPNIEKIVAFARRWGEDKLLFENLSNKRPDDFTKYAIDYHKEWQQLATALGTKPTWAGYIKMMGVAQRILGKGPKVEPIAIRGYEYMTELRRERAVGEKYVRQVQEKGILKYEDKNYIGELAGRVPVPDLRMKTVYWDDKQANNGKAPSIVTIAGFPGEVDEEGTEHNVLTSMKAASILTEETYQHERQKVARGFLKRNPHRPLWTELWEMATGKKIINYLAVEKLHMPPEYFMEFVIGASADFAGLWWKYLNGQGAPSHH